MKLEFSPQILEIYSNIICHKNLLLEADLFHAGGEADGRAYRRTDMTNLIVAFCNFAIPPESRTNRT